MPSTLRAPFARNADSGLEPSNMRVVLALALVFALAPAWGQVPPASENSPVQPKVVAASTPFWRELSPNQQAILAPLAPSWDSLESARKRKWISVALTYPQLAPAEQTKLQGRMAEWAALSPRERAVARLNFSESKKLPASDRAADWDAYKALAPEDRLKFVAEAASAPKGAALAPKRSTVDKVTPVPVTRRTPSDVRDSAGLASPSIDRKTLLPQPAKPSKVGSPAPIN